MNNRNLKKTMAQGSMTSAKLNDALYGTGGGSNEQYDKLKVVVGGRQLNPLAWTMGKLPYGDAVLVWEHTGQTCRLDRQVLESVLDAHTDRNARAAAVEAENEAPHTTAYRRNSFGEVTL